MPSSKCLPIDGCAGSSDSKYQEGGRFGNTGTHEDFSKSLRVTANIYQDEVVVNGITANDMQILSIQQAIGLPSYMGKAIALMGLAFHNIDDTGRNSFFEEIITQKTIGERQPEISFFLGRKATGVCIVNHNQSNNAKSQTVPRVQSDDHRRSQFQLVRGRNHVASYRATTGSRIRAYSQLSYRLLFTVLPRRVLQPQRKADWFKLYEILSRELFVNSVRKGGLQSLHDATALSRV